MKLLLKSLFFTFCLILLHSSLAKAQSLRGSLSQLEFDKKHSEHLRARLVEKKADKEPIIQQTNIEQTEIKSVEMPEYVSFREIIPSNNIDLNITTSVFWEKNKNGGCKNTTVISELTQKSRALNEILSKYTGSQDAYRALTNYACQSTCKDSSLRSYPTDLTIKKDSGINFSEYESNSQCFFKIENIKAENKVAFFIEKVACSCLPQY